MKLSNVDAIYAEYPFIEKILPRAKANEVEVSCWSKDFLTQKNKIDHFEDTTLTTKSTRFYLLDEYGNIVTRVGAWFLFFLFVNTTETVGQALYRIGSKTRRICYAAQIWRGNELHFYKLPNGYKNAEDWFNAEMKEDRKAMRQL